MIGTQICFCKPPTRQSNYNDQQLTNLNKSSVASVRIWWTWTTWYSSWRRESLFVCPKGFHLFVKHDFPKTTTVVWYRKSVTSSKNDLTLVDLTSIRCGLSNCVWISFCYTDRFFFPGQPLLRNHSKEPWRWEWQVTCCVSCCRGWFSPGIKPCVFKDSQGLKLWVLDWSPVLGFHTVG